ncbi:putative oxidoreductase [Thalassocella blandensis]|nr:putative oxidoreductase [Thalassocella blandensis]
MSTQKTITGGGFKAIRSVLRYSRQIGPVNLWRTLHSKNACKACAFGTGGQNGGLHNEARQGIEICNKNIQAHLSDIRAGIPNQVFFENSINALQQLSGKALEDLGRLTTPLHKKAGDLHYSPTTYEQAFETIVKKLKASEPDRTFFYASGRSSNEAAFSMQLMARLYGTNNINNCSYYCHQASGVGLTATVGTGTATIRYDDLNKADLIFVFGANPASNHPRYVKTLLKCRRRGGKVVVINPAKEPGMLRFASPSDWRSMMKGGEEVASHYVQPHLGGDLALIQGIIKYLLENNLHNAEFISQHTSGFDAYQQHILALSWTDLEHASGVSQSQIEEIAQLYSQAKNTIFSWSMGLTHHTHGVGNIESVVALALVRGMIGKPGCGLLPLRGHSNIQGTGSMGFTPQLKQAIETNIEQKLGPILPKTHGMDTMSCMHAAHNGDIQAAVMLGGNLLASNPDFTYASAALNKIPFKCYISSTINMSHVHAVDEEVVILPIRVRDEEQQPTTQESMFNFVRLSEGGIERFAQLKSEIEIICKLGAQLIDNSTLDFSLFLDHEKVRQFVGDVIPGFHNIQTIDENKEEFHIDGRTLYSPEFPTDNGKAKFKIHPLPRISSQYRLTSIRSEGQFNSIIYDERDTYRGQNERWVVLMNPDDMKKEGLQENQCVSLSTATGQMKDLKVKAFDVRQGNLMTYYPEANILIPNTVDSESGTPGFKSVEVELKI